MPVSDRFAPLRQREMFLFNALLLPDVKLDLLEEADAAIAWRSNEQGSFELLDIVGTRIPTLADILASLLLSPSHVTVHFAPDRLAWHGAAEPDESGMVFMLRSSRALEPKTPFALPPMAEF
jgi:hypothetical protein